MSTDKTAEISKVPQGLEDLVTFDRPTGSDTGTLGSEGIGRDDILMPRIAVAQKMSPEIDPTHAKFIKDLQFTDLFHTLTRKNLGKGPLHFCILRRDEPRWIEFNPIDEGGGIKDKDVRKGDPRTEFHGDEKPVATEFHDYIVLLLTGMDLADPMASIVGLSLKSTGIRAAKHLNLLVQMRGPKLICKGVYALTTGHETDKKTQGTYATYKFQNAGWLKPDSQVEKLAVELFKVWKDRKVEFERDNPDDFEPMKYEAAVAGGARTDM